MCWKEILSCMANILNESFRGGLFEHVFLAAGVLGCVGYRLVKRFSLGALCLYFGWMSALVMVCYSGQRLINESTAIGEAIYNTDWYNFECALQKELMMVILRSQKPIHLEAGSFGNMTYTMFMMILKTSYSYLTLLRRSNNRQ